MKGGYTSGLVKCRGRSCHCVHCYSDEAQDVDAGGCPNVDWMPDELQWLFRQLGGGLGCVEIERS